MASISGLGTTYNLPNFVGELHAASPEDTPLLSAIGGLTGGESVGSTLFTWQGYDLRDADDGRQRKEGADAPTAEERARFGKSNVLEIHQEQVAVSYTKQGATRQVSTNSAANVQLGNQPVQSELTWQIQQELKQIARDVEKSFIVGTYNLPTDNTTERKTRGLLEAITTNAVDLSAAEQTGSAAASTDVITLTSHGLSKGDGIVFTDLGTATGLSLGKVYFVAESGFTTGAFEVTTKAGGAAVDITADGTVKWKAQTVFSSDDLIDLMQSVWESGGIQESETRTLVAGARQKRNLTKAFVSDKNYQETSRNVGGVNVQTIETDFGRVNIMLDRYMPANGLAVVSLEQLAPAYLEVPGKGHFFAEPLAKTGASDKVQLYGEIGLIYGNEMAHGQLTGIY